MYIELVRQLMPAMGNTEQYRTVKGLNDLTELRLNKTAIDNATKL